VEVRLQIYELAFETTVIELKNFAEIKSLGKDKSSRQHHRGHDPLALLKTCRQIYNEAANMLCSSFIFNLEYNDMTSFFHNANLLSPESFDVIRSLRISCGPVSRPFGQPPAYRLNSHQIREFQRKAQEWKDFWKFVQDYMRRLANLRVRVTLSWAEISLLELSMETEWVQPLLRIHGLEHLSFRVLGMIGPYNGHIYHKRSMFMEALLRQRLCKPGSYTQRGMF
jgi:hypothetical protein